MKKIFLLCSVILVALSLKAQVQDPVTWTFSQKDLGDGEYELTFKASIKPGWTIYSMFTPDGGPFQTALEFDDEKAVQKSAKATEGKPTIKHDKVFGVDVWYFEKEYVLKQKVKVGKSVKSVKGYIEYQVCQEGQCVLFDKEFNIVLK